MSKAFVKEPEAGDVYDDLPDRPVSPHNLVTAHGLELIEAELARLHVDHAAAQDANDKAKLAKINRDLRYWTSRRATPLDNGSGTGRFRRIERSAAKPRALE